MLWVWVGRFCPPAPALEPGALQGSSVGVRKGARVMTESATGRPSFPGRNGGVGRDVAVCECGGRHSPDSGSHIRSRLYEVQAAAAVVASPSADRAEVPGQNEVWLDARHLPVVDGAELFAVMMTMSRSRSGQWPGRVRALAAPRSARQPLPPVPEPRISA